MIARQINGTSARVAKLADAHDSGSCGRPYGFKSLLSHQIFYNCGRGGTGRRVRLRGVWETVWVQVPSAAPTKERHYIGASLFFVCNAAGL